MPEETSEPGPSRPSISPSRRRSSSSRIIRSRSSRSRATSSISIRSDSSNISSGAALVDWDSGDAYDYVQTDDQISAFLHCPICLGPFMDPYVSESCSHTFCKQCINTAFANPSAVHDQAEEELVDTWTVRRCPSCRSAVQLADFKPTALLIKNMVDTLLVRCPNRAKGCKHTCERHLLRGHVGRDCEFEYVDKDLNEGKMCGCSEKVMRKDWSSHGFVCPKRKVRCEACQEEVRFDEMEEHCRSCAPEPADCDYCGHQSTKSTLPLHLCTCLDAPVACSLAQYGCDWAGPRWQLCRAEGQDRDPETEAARVYHQDNCRYEPIKAFFSIFSQQNGELRNENVALKRRLDEFESRQRSQDRRLDDCTHSLGSWYRSAGQAGTSQNFDPSSGSQGGSLVESDWDEFPLDVQNWDRTTRPSLRRGESLNRADSIGRLPIVEGPAVNPLLSPVSPQTTSPFPTMSAYFTPATRTPQEGVRRNASLHPPTSRSAPATSPLQVPLPRSAGDSHPGPVSIESHMFDVDTTNLDAALQSLRVSIGAIANGLSALERRNEEGHLAAVSAGFEAGRAQEEVGSLRHAVHAVRMQIHQILMQQQRHALFSPTQGDAATPPAPVTVNPPMLVRRWAGFDQTKL